MHSDRCAAIPGQLPHSIRGWPRNGRIAPARFGLRRVSLMAQVSLSLGLLLTAGLFLHELLRFRNTDPGFAVNNRTYVTTLPPLPRYREFRAPL